MSPTSYRTAPPRGEVECNVTAFITFAQPGIARAVVHEQLPWLPMFGRRKAQLLALTELRSELAAVRQELATEVDARSVAEHELRQLASTATAHTAEQAQRIASLDLNVANLQTLLASTNVRVDEVATTLTNQLDEVSGQVEAVGERALSTDAVDDIRAAQIRLANEQARYEIALRADLAALGEQLRKSPR